MRRLNPEEVGHGSKGIMVPKLEIASFATDRRSGRFSRGTLRGGKIQKAVLKSGTYHNS